MQAVRIDTLEYAKRLEDSGIKHDHAVAQTQVYADMLWSVVDSTFVKKDDLFKMEKRLTELNGKTNERINELSEKIQANREQIQAVEHRLDSKIERLDSKIERLDSKVDNLSFELSMKLGKIVVGSTSVLGVLLGLFITAIKLFG